MVNNKRTKITSCRSYGFSSHPQPSLTIYICWLSGSQIDVLQAEVTALKTLVLTSTPSSPNRQLHPQLQSSGTRGAYRHVGGHIRNKSASGAFPSSPGKPEHSSVSIQPVAKEDREVTRMKFVHLPLISSKCVSAALCISSVSTPHISFL